MAAADEILAEVASTADKVMAEASSTADQVVPEASYTVDQVIHEAAPTVDEVVPESASTAVEIMAAAFQSRGRGHGHGDRQATPCGSPPSERRRTRDPSCGRGRAAVAAPVAARRSCRAAGRPAQNYLV